MGQVGGTATGGTIRQPRDRFRRCQAAGAAEGASARRRRIPDAGPTAPGEGFIIPRLRPGATQVEQFSVDHQKSARTIASSSLQHIEIVFRDFPLVLTRRLGEGIEALNGILFPKARRCLL